MYSRLHTWDFNSNKNNSNDANDAEAKIPHFNIVIKFSETQRRAVLL